MNWWVEFLFTKIPFVKRAKGEDAICLVFASQLQKLTRQGKIKCVWFHVANEFAGKQRPVFGAKLKAMGKVSGVSDYIFMWDNGCIAMEFKTKLKSSKQSKGQLAFEAWCKEHGVPYFVVRSSEEALLVLTSFGRI